MRPEAQRSNRLNRTPVESLFPRMPEKDFFCLNFHAFSSIWNERTRVASDSMMIECDHAWCKWCMMQVGWYQYTKMDQCCRLVGFREPSCNNGHFRHFAQSDSQWLSNESQQFVLKFCRQTVSRIWDRIWWIWRTGFNRGFWECLCSC